MSIDRLVFSIASEQVVPLFEYVIAQHSEISCTDKAVCSSYCISNYYPTNFSTCLIHVNIFYFHLYLQSKNLTQIANILDVDQCVPSSDVNIDSENCITLMAIEQTNSSNNVYVTVCYGSTATMQLPIIFATVTMILILGLSCGAIYILHSMLDPVKMMKMSRSCYTSKFLNEIWPHPSFSSEPM